MNKPLTIGLIATTLILLFTINHVAVQFIDTSNAQFDQIIALQRTNAEQSLLLEQAEARAIQLAEQARAAEAVWWSDNSGALITFFLRGQHEEAQELIREQGARLDSIDL